MRGGRLCRVVLRMAGSHSAVARQEHISLRVIAIPIVRAIKQVSVQDAPFAPLWGKINIFACLRF